MKYSKLKTLLLNIDQDTSEDDILINLNDEVALRLRSNYGAEYSNNTCNNNNKCSGNDSCKGNAGCTNNSVCNPTCTP